MTVGTGGSRLKVIDLDSWPRRSQFDFFRGVAKPHFSLTASVDATRLVEDLKPKGVSLFNAALFAIMAAANGIPELRTRFRGGQVIEHELVHASVTVPIEDDRFAFCEIEFSPRWPDFDARCRQAVADAKHQTILEDKVAQRDDWIYLSCLPWIAFTAMANPTNGSDDCTPRICWGKFDRQDGAWRMPVSVEAHHALVDGRHIGKFYQELEQRITADFI